MLHRNAELIRVNSEKSKEIDLVALGYLESSCPVNRDEIYTPFDRVLRELNYLPQVARYSLAMSGVFEEQTGYINDMIAAGFFQSVSYFEYDEAAGFKVEVPIVLVSETGKKLLRDLLRIINTN